MQKNEKPMDIAEVLARRKPQLIAKRAMDILLSACALAVLWPLLLLIALAVVSMIPAQCFIGRCALAETASRSAFSNSARW